MRCTARRLDEIAKILYILDIGIESIPMALSIKDSKTEDLARKLAKHRGISMTRAIHDALAETLANDNGLREAEIRRRGEVIREIQKRVANLPELMSATEVDAWMYDENGLPH
jgi:antitoxin VapB